MFSPQTPASSPLAHLSTHSNYRPQLFHPSSPLVSSGSSTRDTAQRRRSREYKPQTSSRSALFVSSTNEDTPQKQFLRDRFKARCLERMKENRAHSIRRGRMSSPADASSSDGYDMDGDFEMEADDDTLDDELYRRVVMNEQKKACYSQKVSFERDFGSSLDPHMYEDMDKLEWELTGRLPEVNAISLEPEDLDDAQILEYLAELEETQWEEVQHTKARCESGVIDLDTEDAGALEQEFTRGSDPPHPSPSRSMYSDFETSSPTSSLISKTPFTLSPSSTWSCPFCSTIVSREQIACRSCMTQYPLLDAEATWLDQELHPDAQHRNHVPLATLTPSESGIGVVMLCGASGCDWCFAL